MNSTDMFQLLQKTARDWHKKQDAENATNNIAWLQEHCVSFADVSVKVTPWVFSHIPKTAGTSLESYLAQIFELKDLLHINAPDLNRLPQIIYAKSKYPHLIMGHHPIHGLLYQLLPQKRIVHLTMLREPVSRVISYYNYIATREYHALHQQVKDLDFQSFLSQNNMVELNNGQAKRLAGYLHCGVGVSDNELYLKAKYVVDNCFSLVGVTEYFKQFHQLLGEQCGIKFNTLPPINRSTIKIQLKDLSHEQLQAIEINNKVDIQLYNYVKAKFLQLTQKV